MEIIKAPVQETGEKGLHEHGIVATLCDDSHFHLVFDQRLDVDIQPELEDFSLTVEAQRIELENLSLTSGTRGEVGWSLISFKLTHPIKPGTPIQIRYHPRQYFLWSEERDGPIEGFELFATVADVNILKALDLRTGRGSKRPQERETLAVKIKANVHIVEACDRQVRIALKHLLETSSDPKAEDFHVESSGRSLNMDRVYISRVANGAELSLLLREVLEPNHRVKISYKPGRRPLRTPAGQQLQSFQIEGFASSHPLDIADANEQTGTTFDDIDQLLELAKRETGEGEKKPKEESNKESNKDSNNVVSLFEKSKEHVAETPKEIAAEDQAAPAAKHTEPKHTESEQASDHTPPAVETAEPTVSAPQTEAPAIIRKAAKFEPSARALPQQVDVNTLKEESERSPDPEADNPEGVSIDEMPVPAVPEQNKPSLRARLKQINPLALLAVAVGAVLISWLLFALINFFVFFFNFESYTEAKPSSAEQPNTTTSDPTQNVGAAPAANERQPCEKTYDDGSHFQGSCLNGQRDGGGNYTYANGDAYSGEWVQDTRHGNGMLKKANGTVYAGGFNNDKKQGRGSLSWPEGRIYEGEFHNDMFHGQGKLIEPDGQQFEGRFENGQAVEGTCTMPDGIKISEPCKVPD